MRGLLNGSAEVRRRRRRAERIFFLGALGAARAFLIRSTPRCQQFPNRWILRVAAAGVFISTKPHRAPSSSSSSFSSFFLLLLLLLLLLVLLLFLRLPPPRCAFRRRFLFFFFSNRLVVCVCVCGLGPVSLYRPFVRLVISGIPSADSISHRTGRQVSCQWDAYRNRKIMDTHLTNQNVFTVCSLPHRLLLFSLGWLFFHSAVLDRFERRWTKINIYICTDREVAVDWTRIDWPIVPLCGLSEPANRGRTGRPLTGSLTVVRSPTRPLSLVSFFPFFCRAYTHIYFFFRYWFTARTPNETPIPTDRAALVVAIPVTKYRRIPRIPRKKRWSSRYPFRNFFFPTWVFTRSFFLWRPQPSPYSCVTCPSGGGVGSSPF